MLDLEHLNFVVRVVDTYRSAKNISSYEAYKTLQQFFSKTQDYWTGYTHLSDTEFNKTILNTIENLGIN